MDNFGYYPPDTRSTYAKTAEALSGKSFDLKLSVPVNSDNPQRFFWRKGSVLIMVDCKADRVERIRLTVGNSIVGHWKRIKAVFTFLENHGWEGK